MRKEEAWLEGADLILKAYGDLYAFVRGVACDEDAPNHVRLSALSTLTAARARTIRAGEVTDVG